MMIESIEKFENEIAEQICSAPIPDNLSDVLLRQVMQTINFWYELHGVEVSKFRLHHASRSS